ncbi:MAG: flagellar hook protein FlgE [Alphaproteobacteria bacterium]|nr:flagellar hook protein FlgE [Alphaproteobacteria bacterium]
MSIYGALFTGVAGLNANSRALSNTSTNIANVNTVGYKTTQSQFSTLLAENVDIGQFSSGGVKAVPVQEISHQGEITQTSSSTDLSISGNGFFVVTKDANADPSVSQLLYTRAGNFVRDADGFLRNASGYYLQGWQLDDNGDIPSNPADVTAIDLGQITGTAEPTTTVGLRINLQSSATAQTYTAGDMNAGTVTPQYQTGLEVYDSQGGSQPIRLAFVKTGANTWAYEAIYDGDPANIGGAANNPIATGTITFNTDGTIATPASAVSITIPWAAASGLASQTIDFNLGTPGTATGLTQYDAASTLYATQTNGALFGALTGVRVDGDGKVIALFDNGIEKPIYQLPIATFLNPDGLRALDGNAYAGTVDSGDVSLKVASQGGAGTVQSSALEQSTVDLAKEFSDMIVIQRAYSAASKIITTADEMLDELTRLKR